MCTLHIACFPVVRLGQNADLQGLTTLCLTKQKGIGQHADLQGLTTLCLTKQEVLCAMQMHDSLDCMLVAVAGECVKLTFVGQKNQFVLLPVLIAVFGIQMRRAVVPTVVPTHNGSAELPPDVPKAQAMQFWHVP